MTWGGTVRRVTRDQASASISPARSGRDPVVLQQVRRVELQLEVRLQPVPDTAPGDVQEVDVRDAPVGVVAQRVRELEPIPCTLRVCRDGRGEGVDRGSRRRRWSGERG